MRATPFDIFRKDLLGTPVWMETVEDIETAKCRVRELADRSPGEYFVFSRETEEIVINTVPRVYELVVPDPVFSRAGELISILYCVNVPLPLPPVFS